MNDKFKVIGRLILELRDELGQLKDKRDIPNLVVNTGLYHIADQLADSGEAAMSHMAIGAGAVAPAPGDTALGSELARVALSSVTQGAGGNANQVTYLANFGAGVGTGAVTEAGILNAAAVGVLLCRATFSVINKAAGDALTITWVLTISAA